MTTVTKKSVSAQWVFDHVGHTGDDCLIWPFKANLDGYGAVMLDKKRWPAHRLMCELVNGPPPTPKHQAAHECGNGPRGCVNPKHLKWKTQHENQQDRWKHGTQNIGNRGKLTYAERMEIRELRGEVTQAELARRYGVDRTTISCIHRKEPKKYRGIRKSGAYYNVAIYVDGKRIKLGFYRTIEAADAAYQAAHAALLGRT